MVKETRSLRIDFLETFLAVCELKSFSKAGDKLQKSQGGISQQITQLEEYFSAKLINRTSHGFSLTPEGQLLFEKSREILRLVDLTKKDILEKAKVLSGKVTICASSTPGEYILPRFIAEFRGNNPHVEFVVNISNTGFCLKKLQSKEYDLIAVGSLLDVKDTSEIVMHPIAEEEIVIVCAPSHPILRKATLNRDNSRYRVPSSELENYAFIVREKQSGTQREFEKQYGKKLKVSLELNSPQAIITAVQNSEMLGILSAIVSKKAESAGLINILEIEGQDPIVRKILLIRPKHQEMTDVVRKFWDYVVSNPFEVRGEW